MQAISLFSGVGGFELGFERAGIETILQAEQDAKCQHVLERHWPNVERVNDVRDITAGTADLIYGGFPCQDLSVAGRRAGLGGDRSSLWFEFARVLGAVRPRWCVVENVPGLLSSAGGRDFGIILHDLDELGYDIAWGTLDAQHFGVPQRRRRVFVIGGPRGPGPAAVLALAEGGTGDSQAGGTAGQDVAGTLGGGAGSRGWADDLDRATFIATAITASAGHHGHSSPRGDGADNLVYPALDARHGKGASSSVDQAPPILTSPVTAKWAKGSGGPSGDEAQNLVVPDIRGVRRLMPIECERLMGWPDDWTRWDVDGNEIADSHRYRMCGNGVVAPVAEWIGHRLVRVDSLLANSPADAPGGGRGSPTM
ncbi:site-specific DNA methylase [uncultured Mediterranean phage uvDeep-CGR2-KM24-C26]|nr:site-specific DNA methylase [uncultured Mediterranean phage uvDeep-CGR2-KM24-C26]